MAEETFKPLLANVIGGVRKEYRNEEEPFLLEKNMDPNPLLQFRWWFKNIEEKVDQFMGDHNAVCVSTVNKDGSPSSRMVLLKIFDDNGFTFFTNSTSRKGGDLKTNPRASMLFYWPMVARQVRIEGTVTPGSEELADKYWLMRPLESRIGAKISEQSSVIPSREYLDNKRIEMEKLAAENGEEAITRPKSWMAFTLQPNYYEFWQGQHSRIHDRIAYKKKEGSEEWDMFRLSP